MIIRSNNTEIKEITVILINSVWTIVFSFEKGVVEVRKLRINMKKVEMINEIRDISFIIDRRNS